MYAVRFQNSTPRGTAPPGKQHFLGNSTPWETALLGKQHPPGNSTPRETALPGEQHPPPRTRSRRKPVQTDAIFQRQKASAHPHVHFLSAWGTRIMGWGLSRELQILKTTTFRRVYTTDPAAHKNTSHHKRQTQQPGGAGRAGFPNCFFGQVATTGSAT